MKTGATEHTEFPKFCSMVAGDMERMSTFRSAEICRQVVEGLRPMDAADMPGIIMSQTPRYAELLPAFAENDSFGGPATYDFKGFGSFSPTTVRYIKILSDIEYFFGSLDGKSVIEIGGGYGGQCKILKARFPQKAYTIVDLPDVLKLAASYLENTGTSGVVLQPYDRIKDPMSCDLVLSNYAISELNREIQEFYFDSILSGAECGYIIWNKVGQPFGAMGIDAFVSKLKNPRVLSNSLPITRIDAHCDNQIIVWNRKRVVREPMNTLAHALKTSYIRRRGRIVRALRKRLRLRTRFNSCRARFRNRPS